MDYEQFSQDVTATAAAKRVVDEFAKKQVDGKGVKKMELVKMVGMSNSTLNKLNKNQYVALEVIERICLALDCSIADVVKIEKDPDE